MTDDFRTDPMDSPEGKGLGRRAWDAYANAVNKAAYPVAQPIMEQFAKKQAIELVGFWVAWHIYGGFEGLVERAGMHPSTVWRKVKKFRVAFKEHPDVYKMPGVTINAQEFWDYAAELSAARSKSDTEAE